MQTIGNDLWDLTMTFDSFDVDIEYYISAEANNGKFQSKPITLSNLITITKHDFERHRCYNL